MKSIRKKVFETNSSSVHSITVLKENVGKPITDEKIFVALGEFGWELDCYTEPSDILSYLYTAICCNYGQDYKKYIKIIENVLSKKSNVKLSWEEPIFDVYDDKYYLENGYIDHGYELSEWLKEIFDDEELLLATIVGGIIETGNDNGGCYCSEIPADAEIYYSYDKGN